MEEIGIIFKDLLENSIKKGYFTDKEGKPFSTLKELKFRFSNVDKHNKQGRYSPLYRYAGKINGV